MTLESLIQQYGYIAIYIGTMLEGETVLVLGGFLANQGFLEIQYVMLAAGLGGFSGDSISFTLGRFKGVKLLKRHRKLRRRTVRARKLARKYGHIILPFYRFLYGLRAAIPFVFGLNRMAPPKFFMVAAISACVWAITVGTAGYFFGKAANLIIGNIQRYQMWILLGLVVIACFIWILRLIHTHSQKNLSDNDSQ